MENLTKKPCEKIQNQSAVVRRLTDFTIVEGIYQTRMKEDFARNELKPLKSMKKLWDDDSYDCFGLYEGASLLGYALFVHQGQNYLLDYFAVAKEHRGEGFGSVFLQQLSGAIKEADCVIAEVEDPAKATDQEERDLREQRIQFYLRNGYHHTGLTARLFGVDYLLLEATGKAHSMNELRETYRNLYRKMLSPFFFMTQVRVKKEQISMDSIR